jgi:integrase
MTDPVRRQRRQTLTDRQVAERLRPKRGRYFHPDPELPKHGVRVQPDGAKSFYVITRNPWGKQLWVRIGSTAELKIEDARDIARVVIKRVEAGEPAFPPTPVQPKSFKEVADTWLKRHVAKEKLRSEAEITRCLTKYVYPIWQDRPFTKLRRSDVTTLLDGVEDNHGSRQADLVLAIIQRIMRWHATRGSDDEGDDDYVAPIVPGMRRWKSAAHRRKRVLTDDEIRVLWACSDELGAYGALVKLALLTGQRRDKVATLQWDDIRDGVWHVRREHAREKGTAAMLRLPPLALAVIEAQPAITGNPHVFAAAVGKGAFNSFSQRKDEFDALMRKRLPKIPAWVFHDLRRSARSLLSRAHLGVSSEHAERVLGHAIPGVEAVYDMHAYTEEIGHALSKLADEIARIVKNAPEGDNVVPFSAPATRS